MRTLFTLVVLGSLLERALATDYYVNAATGSNANPGTKTAPFQSISHAVSVTVDNDRIFVEPGTYSLTATQETFTINVGSPTLPVTQMNVHIISTGGSAVTVIDGEGNPASGGCIRFRFNGQGGKLIGFTIRGFGAIFGVLRIGTAASPSSFATHGIEVANCVIEGGNQGIATFGDAGLLTPIMIHDNLIVGAVDNGLWISSIPANGASGNGGGEVYNNTIVAGTNNGVRIQGGNWVVHNNIVANNPNFGFFNGGTVCCPLPVVENYSGGTNDVAGNGTDYDPTLAGLATPLPFPTDILPPVDPLFVSTTPPADYHIQTASSLVDVGTSVLPAYVATDGEGDPRSLDGDLNGLPVPDVGFDEAAKYRYLLLAGSIKQGSTATFDVTGVAGTTADLAILLFSAGTANLTVPPFGTLLLDPFLFFSLFPIIVVGGGFPAVVGPVPVDPALNGVWIYSQAAVLSLVSAPGLGQLTNRLDNQL